MVDESGDDFSGFRISSLLLDLTQACLTSTLAKVKPALIPASASVVSAVIKYSLSYCQGNFAQTEVPSGASSSLSKPITEVIELENFGEVEISTWNKGNVGRPLLLLHGFNSHALIWTRLASRLVHDHHLTVPIIAMTMPGHGRSFTPDVPLTLALTVAVVEQAMNFLGLTSVNLVGHSWGGKVAQAVAAACPARIASLILCDPVPPQGYLPFSEAVNFELLNFCFTPERKTFTSRAEWAKGAQGLAHIGWGADQEGDAKLWESMYIQLQTPTGKTIFKPRVSDKTFHEIINLQLSKDIHEEVLANVSCPVLLFIPSFSVAAWPGGLQYLLKLPGIEVSRISGDHCHQYTNPIDTALEFTRFLTAHNLLEEEEEGENSHGISPIPTTVSSFSTLLVGGTGSGGSGGGSGAWYTISDELFQSSSYYSCCYCPSFLQ